MATLADLEEHLRCPICLETFKNPHELTCQHSFCLQCISNLDNSCAGIKCPECRELCSKLNVKKDFKLQRLVDLYSKNELSGSELNTLQSTIKKIITDLEKIKEDMQVKRQKIDESMKAVYENQMKQETEVDNYATNFIKAIQENCRFTKRTIKEYSQQHINRLDKDKEMCEFGCLEIQSKINLLKENVSTNNVTTLSKLVGMYEKNTSKEVENVTKCLTKIDPDLTQPLSIVLGQTWGPEYAIKIKINGAFPSNQQGVVYSSTILSNYRAEKCIDLGYPLYSIIMIDNELWGVGDNIVSVFNKDCQRIRKYTHPCIQNANDIAYSETGHIFIACYNGKGLLQLDHNGKFHGILSEGNFSSVHAFKTEVFALEYDLSHVFVFVCKDNVWVKRKQIELDTIVYKSCSEDKIKVNSNGLYISSYTHHCLHLFTLEGHYRKSTGMNGSNKAGEFNAPYLCDVDKEGNAIIADKYNKRLQLELGGEWRIVNLLEDLGHPYDAELDSSGSNIWVVTWSSLQRYKRTYASV